MVAAARVGTGGCSRSFLVSSDIATPPDRVTSIVAMAPRLSDSEVALLRSGIATCLADGYRPLTEAISDLPARQQLRLMDNDQVFAAIDSILAVEEEASQENSVEEGESGG